MNANRTDGWELGDGLTFSSNLSSSPEMLENFPSVPDLLFALAGKNQEWPTLACLRQAGRAGINQTRKDRPSAGVPEHPLLLLLQFGANCPLISN